MSATRTAPRLTLKEDERLVFTLFRSTQSGASGQHPRHSEASPSGPGGYVGEGLSSRAQFKKENKIAKDMAKIGLVQRAEVQKLLVEAQLVRLEFGPCR